MIDLAARLPTIEQIARDAGDVLVEYFRSSRVDARRKGLRDVVTAADLASERLVLDRLRGSFPEDGIVGEEGTRVESKSGLRWCVDPLDGTQNYAHGLPIWCVSIALFDGDDPVLGVIHDPLRDATFRAARGLGAWLGDQRLETSGRTDPAEAFVHLTVDFDDPNRRDGIEDLLALFGRIQRFRNLGSAALGLAYVAAGWLDAMLHRSANPWDYGAGVILVREAGGAVSALDGGAYRLETASLAAAGSEALRRSLVDLIATAPSLQ